MSFIEVDNVIHDYVSETEEGGEVTLRALSGVSFTVQAGEFIAILGHNGSGKSTLAKHINALLTPTEGTVWVDGRDTRAEEELLKIRKTAGMVFQNPDNQIIASIVEEDVAFGPENMGVPEEKMLRRVDEALQTVGMTERRHQSPNRLSGGQKQRVAIAGVLAMRPKCIVLDEATAMLDPKGRQEVLKTVSRLNKEEGITILLITHYMEEVPLADRVIVMDGGQIRMTGTPREIFAQWDLLKELRLTVPQITELGHTLKADGLLSAPCVLTAQELAEEICREHPAARSELQTAAEPETQATARKADEQTSAGQAGPETAADGPENAAGGTVSVSDEKTAPEAADGPSGASGQAAAPEEARDVPVLSLEKVGYAYEAGTTMERWALEDINIDIYAGQFIGLLGHTGSGKSTLIQHLNGLVRPARGRVLYRGEDIHGKDFSLRGLRGKVGLVFQYPEYQLFETDVITDVCFGPKNLGLSAQECTARAQKALQAVGLPEKAWKKSPFELSGGQKRRAAIAGVLAMEPEILILDEPTAGLDPAGREEILGRIAALHREKGITVVLVSHSMEDVARMAQRIIVMDHGHVFMDGPAREIFIRTQELEKVHLGSPQVTYALQALRAQGVPVPPSARTVAEAAGYIRQALGAAKAGEVTA